MGSIIGFARLSSGEQGLGLGEGGLSPDREGRRGAEPRRGLAETGRGGFEPRESS